PSGGPAASASTPARTSAPSARPGASSPTTTTSPAASAGCATTASRAGTTTSRSATTRAWRASRPPSSTPSCGTSTPGTPPAPPPPPAPPRHYRELLPAVPGLVLPVAPRAEGHVWHLFVILSRDRPRQELSRALALGGVATGIHYPTPVPFQPAYADLGY